MFKKAEKLNKFLSTLFMVAVFGFFACTIHIFPNNNNASANQDNSSSHHPKDINSGNEISCVEDSNLMFTSNYNSFKVLKLLSFVNFNDSFSQFDLKYAANIKLADNYNYPPPKNKDPIYLKNKILII
jgi:hypothetical protein